MIEQPSSFTSPILLTTDFVFVEKLK